LFWEGVVAFFHAFNFPWRSPPPPRKSTFPTLLAAEKRTEPGSRPIPGRRSSYYSPPFLLPQHGFFLSMAYPFPSEVLFFFYCQYFLEQFTLLQQRFNLSPGPFLHSFGRAFRPFFPSPVFSKVFLRLNDRGLNRGPPPQKVFLPPSLSPQSLGDRPREVIRRASRPFLIPGPTLRLQLAAGVRSCLQRLVPRSKRRY